MAGTHLYLQLPETTPASTPWTKLNSDLLKDNHLSVFFETLESTVSAIKHENFHGKYDSFNIERFLLEPEILDDCYPRAARKVMRAILQGFNDCSESIKLNNKNYSIFNQEIKNHLLCEIAEHSSTLNPDENITLFNYHALTINDPISVSSGRRTCLIINLRDLNELTSWFIINRIPKRRFHDTKKHPANNGDPWIGASRLQCSVADAQLLLDSAIGESVTLYNFDQTHQAWIKFMFDNAVNANGEKLYHGYHLDIDTLEVPEKFKRKLMGN